MTIFLVHHEALIATAQHLDEAAVFHTPAQQPTTQPGQVLVAGSIGIEQLNSVCLIRTNGLQK